MSCPSWCTEHVCNPPADVSPSAARYYDQHHAQVEIGQGMYVSVRQIANVDDDPVTIYVNGFGSFRLGQADKLAGLVASLGRKDLAAAIRQLVALVAISNDCDQGRHGACAGCSCGCHVARGDQR